MFYIFLLRFVVVVEHIVLSLDSHGIGIQLTYRGLAVLDLGLVLKFEALHHS